MSFLALVRKELRGTAAYLAFLLLLALMDTLGELLAGAPDESLLKSGFALFQDGGAPVVSSIFFLLALAFGQSLIASEMEEGTIAFLDSLPTTRTRVFFAKLLTAWGMMVGCTLLMSAAGLVMHALSRTSLERGFHLDLVGTALALSALQLFVVVGLGFVLSFFGRFGWLTAAVLFIGVDALTDFNSAFEVLSPGHLTEPRWQGAHWVVPWPTVWVQLALGGLLVSTAWALFVGAGDAVVAFIARAQRRALGWVLLFFFAMVTFSGIAVLVAVSDSEPSGASDDDDGGESYASLERRRARTRSLVIDYPGALASRARTIIERGDEVHEQVRAYVGADSIAPIRVDATQEMTGSGLHGLAEYGTAQISLVDLETEEEILGVLAHEMTHLYLTHLSDRRMRQRFDATRALNEGISKWVQLRLFGGAERAERSRLAAAIFRSRERVDLEELFDNEKMEARYDDSAVYDLGEALAEAIVQTCGSPALFGAVRELADERLAKVSEPIAMWRDAFGRVGCDLDDAADRFDELLDETLAARAEWAEALPHPVVTLSRRGAWLVATVGPDEVRPHAHCRFRSSADASDSSVWKATADAAGECLAPWSRWSEGAVDIQVGFRAAALRHKLWGRWERYDLSRVVEEEAEPSSARDAGPPH
jgi:hypothetical protein